MTHDRVVRLSAPSTTRSRHGPRCVRPSGLRPAAPRSGLRLALRSGLRLAVRSGLRSVIGAVLIAAALAGGAAPRADLLWQSADGPPGATTYVVTQDAWGRIYAGTDGMGVFRSSDGGATWEPLGFRGCKVYDVKANPGDPTMLALGCELARRGLFISRNDGATWEECPLNGRIAPCIQIAFDPADPDRLYAGFMSDSLYYSVDRGLHWHACPHSFQKIVGGMPVGYAPSRIHVDPDAANRLLVGTGLELHYIQPGGGFYISEDRGLTWQEVLIQGYSGVLLALDFAPGNPRHLLGSFNGFGVCRSLNGGWSWTSISSFLFADLHFDPLLADHAWACSISNPGYPPGGYESADGGTTWVRRADGLLGTDHWNTLVVGSDAVCLGEWGTGMFKWDAVASRWREINTGLQNTSAHDALEVALPMSAAGGPREGTGVVVGTFENGVFVGDVVTGRWVRANEGLNTGSGIETFFRSLATDGLTTLFMGAEAKPGFDNIYRSRDGADHWQPVKPCGFASMAEDITCLAVSSANPSLVFAARGGGGTAGVYRSVDGGDTWSFRGLAIGAGGTYDVEPHPLAANVVYACAWNGFVVSTNGGESFARVPGFNASLLAIRDLAFDPQDPQRLWVSTQYNGLFRSVNGGTQWDPVPSFQAPTNHWPVSILVDPDDSGHVLIATDRISGEIEASGVYETRDDGVSWQLANDGLRWLSVRKLRVGAGPQLLLANAADGVWRASLGASAVAGEMPSAGRLPERAGSGTFTPRSGAPAPGAELTLTVRPNPAPGKVELALSAPGAGRVELDLFDAAGRRVCRLAAQDLGAGCYALDWDGRGPDGRRLAAGAYFCRLRCKDEVHTRRLILSGE